MYPFITVPVHFQILIMITVTIYPSSFLLFYMSTDVPIHHYTCSVYLFLFGITCTMTFQLVYWGSYTHIHPKIHLPVYPHASPLPKNKELPVTTTTCVPAHICTRSWPYLFIFILSFRLTVKNYPSTFPLIYMSTDVPFPQYSCSVHFFIFRHNLRNDLSTHVLGYLHTNPPESKFTCLPSCFSSV